MEDRCNISNFKKTASPRFMIRGFSVGLRANAEAVTWDALQALGPREFIPPPPLSEELRKNCSRLKTKSEIKPFKDENTQRGNSFAAALEEQEIMNLLKAPWVVGTTT